MQMEVQMQTQLKDIHTNDASDAGEVGFGLVCVCVCLRHLHSHLEIIM